MERLTHRYTDGEAFASIYKVLTCGEHECKGPIISRLAAYEDTGLTPEEIMGLIALPNPPLTIEDLRGIYGEPVWCGPYEWKVCYGVSDFRGYLCLELGGGEAISLVGYGDSWKAYRRKPEEG